MQMSLMPGLHKSSSMENMLGAKVLHIRRRAQSVASPNNNSGSIHDSSSSFTLNPNDFTDLKEVGCGFGGVVFRSLHRSTNTIVACKLVNSRIASAKIRKSIAAELAALQRCHHPNIIECYGAFVRGMQISIVMEYMDVGSFYWICSRTGPLAEPILSRMADCVLHGLVYLHKELNIIHRDLKPSNILLNSKGKIKLCDFGESIQLVNSTAKSLVGTTGYMAPERIKGLPYATRSDVWSLGITLIEMATGYFPYDLPAKLRQNICPKDKKQQKNTNMELDKLSLVELWETIGGDPSPSLDPKAFSSTFIDFVDLCLIKEESLRPDPYTLLSHPFLRKGRSLTSEDFKSWAHSLLALKTP